MKGKDLSGNLRAVLFCAAAGLIMHTGGALAQNVQHLSITQPGGMPGQPIITGIQQNSNTVTVMWDGPSGYYQLFQKVGANGVWQAVGPRTNLVRIATIPSTSSNTFFKIMGPAPQYAGAQACIECHGPVHNTERYTAHSRAFQTLKDVNQGSNPACLPCHTVGYGVPTGFVSQTATPQLAGVQCENCHGPAGYHAANPDDFIARPRPEIAATVCGGCHTGSDQSTYQQWNFSAHAQVILDLNSSTTIDSCGRCHSGSVRLNLLNHQPLPAGDANIGIVCAVCHDPHQTNSAAEFQLRNPMGSTNDYFITTSAPFTSQYNPNINLCAQCHNHRGASWTNNASAPHRSLQYNMLLGSIGELATGPSKYSPASHALDIPNQCSDCHMQKSATPPDQYHQTLTSHSFNVESFNFCLQCHPDPEGILSFAQTAIFNEIRQVNDALNLWATNKAPAALQKYGTRAWEYSTPGDLSFGGPGPDATEQALIPINIRKARFNLYLVQYDGSFGVHNGPYAITLLDTALGWVQQELNP
jgi:cytochrome c554/c'-like protein